MAEIISTSGESRCGACRSLEGHPDFIRHFDKPYDMMVEVNSIESNSSI